MAAAAFSSPSALLGESTDRLFLSRSFCSSRLLQPLLHKRIRSNTNNLAKSGYIFEEVTSAGKWRTGASFFQSLFLNGSKLDTESIKDELLEAIAPLDRGADATPEDQDRVDQIARKLEAVNKVKEPLKSNLLNGKWELLYTTSRAILQNQRPKLLRPNGRIYQAINVDTLRAQNMETWPFFNQDITG